MNAVSAEPDDVRIRVAAPADTERLRAIAAAAKGSWGYDPRLVKEWASSLDVHSVAENRREVYVAEVDGRAVAWMALLSGGVVAILDDLWVDPAWARRKIGSRLFQVATERAHARGFRGLEWEAEPRAVGFYEKMGGQYLRDSRPGVWGRTNPVMGLNLPSVADSAQLDNRSRWSTSINRHDSRIVPDELHRQPRGQLACVYRPSTSISASSTARSSCASSRPAERPSLPGSTTVACSASTRVSWPPSVIVGRKLAARALIDVGVTRTVLRSRNSSACTTTA